MALNIDKMNAILEAIKIFTTNHDTFTLDNVIREIENNVNWYDGDPNDDRVEIEKAIKVIIEQLYPEYRRDYMVAYHYDTTGGGYIEEEIEEEIDDINVDKEGNKLPYPDDDTIEEKPGAGYYKDPVTGEWEWDRDAAETERMNDEYEWDDDNDGADFRDTDHIPTHDLVVDKNKRINIKKAVFEDAEWDTDEKVIVISNVNDNTHLYIIKQDDLDTFVLNEDEFIVGEYQLKKGALRIGIGKNFDCKAGSIIHAKANWDDPKCVYVEIFAEE